MIVIPLENDKKTIAKGFRKAPFFVFIDKEKGIVFQENHYKHDKAHIFFENFKNYDIDSLYVKGLGYKTYLNLDSLGIKVYLLDEVKEFSHIDMNKLIEISSKNAKDLCTLGHNK